VALDGKAGPERLYAVCSVDPLPFATVEDAMLLAAPAPALGAAAQESAALGGSFFTHHLDVGLRGAADADGDGQVTLAEAFRYTSARTVAQTAATQGGVQHPTYDFRMSGRLVVLGLTIQPGAGTSYRDVADAPLGTAALFDQVVVPRTVEKARSLVPMTGSTFSADEVEIEGSRWRGLPGRAPGHLRAGGAPSPSP
jgi:hypothetical protein